MKEGKFNLYRKHQKYQCEAHTQKPPKRITTQISITSTTKKATHRAYGPCHHMFITHVWLTFQPAPSARCRLACQILPTRAPQEVSDSMVVFGSRKRWAWWHIIPQLAVHTTYIPLIYCLLGGLYGTYHLLWEPETTIDKCLLYKKMYTTPQKIKMSLKRESFQKERLASESHYFHRVSGK